MDFRTGLRAAPLLAILRNVPTEIAADYAEAAVRGGVKYLEVALNSADALTQIALLREKLDGRAHVGAGTAITVALAKAAVDAGAEFLLAPSTDADVLAWAQENNVPMLPGVMTPSDVSVCLRYGFDVLKLFPAGDLPASYVKSLKGPFDGTDYVAIGGVNRETMRQFLRRGCIAVGMGSNLMPKPLVAARDWQGCADYVAETMKELREAAV